ncbi:MAG: PD-(D/E)XK nuclease family protein [Janthinobacterium lividum]
MPDALDTLGLLSLLDTGAPVILPNARSAKAIRRRFDRQQRACGLRVWEPAAVFAWTEWIESLWSALTLEGLDDRVLLNRLQEHALWTEVISASTEAAHLTPGGVQELATLARSGLELAAAHNLVDRLRASADSSDARAFASWQAAFVSRCHHARFVSRSLLPEALGEHLRSATLPLPETLHLVGFDRFTPAQESLLDDLRSLGCTLRTHDLAHTGAEIPVRGSVLASDPNAELRQATFWLRNRLSRNENELETVAFILPDPTAERPLLEPLFREILAPELSSVHTDLSSMPWQFGAGPLLSTLAVVQHALLLIRWMSSELSLEDVGTLLLSPYLGHTEPFEARARFEMHGLRRSSLLRPELSLEPLLQLAHRDKQGLQLPELQAVRQLLHSHLFSGKGSHGDWTEAIRRLLRSAGWPGLRTLSPLEFQATETWEGVLDLLATLDVTGRRISFPELLALLEQEVQTLSTAEAAVDAPIQILRLHETEGCVFDAVLLLRATDDNLPAPERVHPLISWTLQRSLGLPGAEAGTTLNRCQHTVRGLATRCGDLLFSSARADENGSLRSSLLVAGLDLSPLALDDLLPPPLPGALLEPELVADSTPLPPLPTMQVAGGARLLELQAACGFRAFTELRLGAGRPETHALGLDARDAGSLLHRALEFFWTEVQTQATLRSFSAQERSLAVQRSVAHAFTPLRQRAPASEPWTKAYLDVLAHRLRSLVGRWLENELQRGDFTVLPPEQKQTVTVGPLELSIRPDRVDRVDGGFVLIDYKTSAALSTDDWLGERPDAPQLPLYALLGDTGEFRALAFARLRPGKAMTWLSLEDQPGIFPAKRGGSLHDLATQIEFWRLELDRLAEDFASGQTDVHPKTYPHTCQYCQQRLLCRLDAATLLSNADDQPDSGAEKHDG